MRTIFMSLAAMALLAAPLPSSAQDTGEWELPDNLKGDLKSGKCPKGTVKDEKGFCIKKTAPKPPPEPTKPPEPSKPSVPSRPPTRPPVAPKPPPAVAPVPVVEEKKEEKKAPGEAVPEGTAEGTPEEPKKPEEEKAADEKAPKEKKPKKAFIKGELANFIGSTKLVTKNSRFGVSLGYLLIKDTIHHLTVNPEFDIRIGEKFVFGLGVPLAIEIFNGTVVEGNLIGTDNAGDIRSEDWDEPSEYVRFIRYLRYGNKEDRLFFNLSQHASTSIGHGPLMRHYANNIDPDSSRVSGEIDMYNDYAGFEFVSNNIVNWDIFGGIAFVKPLSFFTDNPTAQSLSLGFTYIADRHAPVTLQLETADYPYLIDSDGGQPGVKSDAFLHAMGVDMEIKVVKTEHVDIKPFIDYSWLMPTDPSGDFEEPPEGGGGLTIGMLGRFNFGEEKVHALRVIAEFRSFSANYLPSYFDTFYEVHKFLFNNRYAHYASLPKCTDPEDDEDEMCLPPTKFEDVFMNRKGDGRHLGFYLEFNYSLVDYITLTLSLEGSDADQGNHFMVHLEVPAISWLRFFASFHQRSMQDLGALFSTDSSDKILFAAARLRLLPFLFINFRYHHTFVLQQFDLELDGDLVSLEKTRSYEPAHDVWLDVELGWEF